LLINIEVELWDEHFLEEVLAWHGRFLNLLLEVILFFFLILISFNDIGKLGLLEVQRRCQLL
jgi:hypothetical protein